MERMLHRDRLSTVMDGIGVRALLLGISILWFTCLWGLGSPALLAGSALGLLLMALRTQWRRRTVERREKALRCRIGAELLLESLLYAEAEEAHRRAAELLGSRWPLQVTGVSADGAMCRQGGEMLLIQYLRMPPDGDISVGDLLNAQRTANRTRAERVVICVPGRTPPKVAARAEDLATPVRILRREVLLSLAGRASPATDAQLVALGQRRQRHLGQRGIAQLIFRRDKAKRYFGYGLVMLLLYVVTGARLYAVPGMVCLTMSIVSRCADRGSDRL